MHQMLLGHDMDMKKLLTVLRFKCQNHTNSLSSVDKHKCHCPVCGKKTVSVYFCLWGQHGLLRQRNM